MLDGFKDFRLGRRWLPFPVRVADKQDVTAFAVAEPVLVLVVERRPAPGAAMTENEAA